MVGAPRFVPLDGYSALTVDEMRREIARFRDGVRSRRTVREFSRKDVPRDIIEAALEAAGSAPSGANLQPWHFAVMGRGPKRAELRAAAEAEEQEFYARRAPKEWLAALAPLGTDASKPFLEAAPYLIGVFAQKFGELPDGRRVKHYYPVESTCLAASLLITALHAVGLACLTHTPSPMGFLNALMGRPDNERALLLLVVGYPASDARVPAIERKALADFVSFIE